MWSIVTSLWTYQKGNPSKCAQKLNLCEKLNMTDSYVNNYNIWTAGKLYFYYCTQERYTRTFVDASVLQRGQIKTRNTIYLSIFNPLPLALYK